MNHKKAILLDFDGVIADTEPLYDKFIEELGIKYNLSIKDFANKVKGTPNTDIIKKYFSHLGTEGMDKVENEILEYELNMDFPPILGALEFISYLRQNEYRLALVTSSQQAKMGRALKILNLEDSFDSIVTADRITKGKPDPMCFLLAAKDLNSSPDNCIVFEDSINGINAAKNAGMKTIGLTTSFSKEQIGNSVFATIPDFADISYILNLIG